MKSLTAFVAVLISISCDRSTLSGLFVLIRIPLFVFVSLRFRVGPQEVHNFRMIERHYHNGTGALMKSYDFNFSFCIPNSTNEWEGKKKKKKRRKNKLQSTVLDASGN